MTAAVQGQADEGSVRIRLFGELARYSGGRGYDFAWPLKPGQSIADVAAAIGIPVAEMWMVAINGQKTNPEALPRPGDEVMIFSPVGGG